MPPKTPPVAHVTPAVAPAETAPARAETCGNCKGALARGGLLQCHGNPPTTVYRQVIMGIGPTGEALWPTVQTTDWCLQWRKK